MNKYQKMRRFRDKREAVYLDQMDILAQQESNRLLRAQWKLDKETFDHQMQKDEFYMNMVGYVVMTLCVGILIGFVFIPFFSALNK